MSVDDLQFLPPSTHQDSIPSDQLDYIILDLSHKLPFQKLF